MVGKKEIFDVLDATEQDVSSLTERIIDITDIKKYGESEALLEFVRRLISRIQDLKYKVGYDLKRSKFLRDTSKEAKNRPHDPEVERISKLIEEYKERRSIKNV